MSTKAPTLRQFQERFPTEESCLEHLFQTRFGSDYNCPGCGRQARYTRVASRRSYQCQWCAHQVYPTAGTPFDRTRTGQVVGEGAGVLILEDDSHARKRGAKIYGRILGAGSACVGTRN